MRRHAPILAGLASFTLSLAIFLTPLASNAEAPSDPTAPTPRIAGHRGTTVGADENTISAMDYAFQNGADILEFDIRLTSDKKMVIMHDATLDRTTNCSGTVASHTLAAIKRCRTAHGQHPPSLRQLLQRVDTYPDTIEIWPELKGAWTYTQVYNAVNELTNYGSIDDIAIQSFSASNLDKVARANDALPDENAGKAPELAWAEQQAPTRPFQTVCDTYGIYINRLPYLKASYVDNLQQVCNPPTTAAIYGPLKTSADFEEAADTHAEVFIVEDPKTAVKWRENR